MVVLTVAAIGLIALVAEFIAVRRLWRLRAHLFPGESGALWAATIVGLLLAVGTLSRPLALSYPIATPTGDGRVIGVPFVIAFFDAEGRDYVGPLTLPLALANAAVWGLLPVAMLVVVWRNAKISERQPTGTNAPREAPSAMALVGCWHLERSEDADGHVGAEMDIGADGQLQYSIPVGDRWQVMKLVWRVEGHILITDQPSSPRQERTSFDFETDGTLVLSHAGARSWFRRGVKRAPAV